MLNVREHYELAVNAARLPVWEYDIRGDRLTGNEYWHQALGRTLSVEEAGRHTETWLSGVHPDDLPKFENVFAVGRADDSGFFEAEYRMQTAGGEYKWLLDRGRVVARDASGAPLSVIGISIDIDERKRAEQALRDSELRLRSVIQAAPVPFALNDELTNITFLNAAFTRTFGYTIADIPTLTEWWTRAYPDPAYRHWVKETWGFRLNEALFHDAPFETMEVIIRCKNGSDRTVLAYAAPLAGSGASSHLVGLLDITEQRVLEQKILAAVSDEQHRIGMDLHDGLGQQLTGLSLMLMAVSRNVSLQGDTHVATELAALSKLASESVASARAIAHGLLPLERGEGAFVRAVRRLAVATQKVSALDVKLSFVGLKGLDLAPSVAAPLFRIIQEALTNAVKHSGATIVRVKIQQVVDVLKLSVTDNGRGVSEERAAAGLGISILRYRARLGWPGRSGPAQKRRHFRSLYVPRGCSE